MPTTPTPCDPARLRALDWDDLPAGELAVLERHLDSCARCRDELDRLVRTDAFLVGAHRDVERDEDEEEEAAVVPEPLDFLTPSDWPDSLGRLGTYEVRGVLGRGGMGVVLKAHDPALGRNVAIKVLSAPLATCGASRRRFLREARAAAAVVHEHVVSVFSVVESFAPPFLVMEYVPGRSLQERIDRFGPLGLAEILRIGRQTAAGLAAAHAQGIVHRDVKPANILLEDGVERVRLTDFGLARAVADAAVTRSGVIAGTPHYMAPEQASGGSIDHRADLFSLGSTLYAALSGRPPFRAETPLGVLRRVCDDRHRPLREANPDVPAWLETIVDRLLSKDPAGRFATADDVADLLGRCLAHVQQPLVAPLPDELARPEARRKRLRRLLIALGALATLAAGVWWPRTPVVEPRPLEPVGAPAYADAAEPPPLPALDPSEGPRPLEPVGAPVYADAAVLSRLLALDPSEELRPLEPVGVPAYADAAEPSPRPAPAPPPSVAPRPAPPWPENDAIPALIGEARATADRLETSRPTDRDDPAVPLAPIEALDRDLESLERSFASPR